MSFSRYEVVIDQMVDLGLLSEMPSRAQLRRDYDRQIRRMGVSVKETIKNKNFQKIEVATRTEKWLQEMEREVLARRGPPVGRTANRRPRDPTVIPPQAQPPNVPRTLGILRQQNEETLDRPRERGAETSDGPRGAREAGAGGSDQRSGVISDRPVWLIEGMPYRPIGQRGEAPGRSIQETAVASERPQRGEETSDRPMQSGDESAETHAEPRADALQTHTNRPQGRSNKVRRGDGRFGPY